MKSTTTALLATILFTGSAAHALTCPKPESQELVGLWETRATSKGGIGHTLEFRQDGTFVEAAAVMVSSLYRVSGDRLMIAEVTADRAENGLKFRIEGDTLLHTMLDGSTLRKERVGKPEEGSPAIVGVWRYRHDTGAIAFERYTGDGRMLLRLPLAGSTGCYNVTGNRISMTSNRGKTAIPFAVRAGELVLENPGKDPTAYGWVAEGPWYDREHLTPL
jgi:hypothetical protein